MKLTEHFSAEEIGWAQIPADVRPNALATLALLETFRRVVGSRVQVTSLWRSGDRNAAVGGVPASQHLDATAADVTTLDVPYDEAWRRARESVELRQAMGQLIGYAGRSHFHIALPVRGKRGEVLWQSGGEYAVVSPSLGAPDLLRFIPADRRALVAALAVAGIVILGD